MKTINVQQPINLKVVRFELNLVPPTPQAPKPKRSPEIKIAEAKYRRKESFVPQPPPIKNCSQKRNVQELVKDLLEELYSDHRDWTSNSEADYTQRSVSAASLASSQSTCDDFGDVIERNYLESLKVIELQEQTAALKLRLQASGDRLARCVRARDRLRRQQRRLCAALTVLLRHITGESGARFGVPGSEAGGAGEGGYAEWLHAMRLVARLPAGVPHHFRRKLWLTLSERHLSARGIDWRSAERACFRGTAQPDDSELGAQILKDLHRTGCSLFCGAEGRENQAMLRRVLLAYARWNKEVGYCQGFNMLAAIILEVMDKSESDSLKVMIYLVEAVLPEGYFADDLRGLSADMAAFRDLLRLRLPRLANHMDQLQRASDGGGVEPPLPDVFTMQWFLTLYATWLPRESLLRIWDLVLLDGNEVLLLTALAIWDLLQERILSARSADEFYSCMGGGVGVVWEAGEALVVRVVALGTAPELPRLRSLHRYQVTPPAPPTQPISQPPLHTAMQTMTKKGLRLFYSEDEGDSSDDGNKLALATMIPRRDNRLGAGDRLSLDIGALKRQYARLRERQRQAHVILAAACARHAAVGVPTSPTSLTMNNLLLGKSAIVSSRGRRLGPPPGSVPPSRHTTESRSKSDHRGKTKGYETISWKEEQDLKTISRRNSVKWKDIKREKTADRPRKTSIDLEETGDGIIVSELEANEMIATVRSRSSSESSSYSSHSASSTDTSLCDENERASDSESDLPAEKPKQPSVLQDTVHNNKIGNITPEKQTDTITEYMDSVAGKPLRSYIDQFQNISNENVQKDCEAIEEYKPKSAYSLDFQSSTDLSCVQEPQCQRNEVLSRLTQRKCDDLSKNDLFVLSVTHPESSKNFTELSPIDISPCDFGHEQILFHLDPDFRTPLSPASIDYSPRPPDIIDSLTMYPNFVPDIDLSEKNISDLESPPVSPGAESIVISEDEPPIPLKIDKYFEHSPEFFGARFTVTGSNNPDIPNRRATKRQHRFPKKPDSLTLKSNNNEQMLDKSEEERASSLPHSLSTNFDLTSYTRIVDDIVECGSIKKDYLISENTRELERVSPIKYREQTSPYFTNQSGRKNSERALQIIQENSKILSRILTKQNILETKKIEEKPSHENLKSHDDFRTFSASLTDKSIDSKVIDSPLLKESTSDSLIGYCKRIESNENSSDKNDFVRTRPISIDDPSSFELRYNVDVKKEDFNLKRQKSPSTVCLENKTDIYGWENKGFMAKSDYKTYIERTEQCLDYQTDKTDLPGTSELPGVETKTPISTEWPKTQECLSGESKGSVPLELSELKDPSTYEKRLTSDDYNYPFSNKYNDFVLSKASDICSKTVDRGPKVCENLSKIDNSQVSDFTHIVTSSISFTYEPSVEDDSPIGAKSNSSDTLCQITSLDQVSTPISPKIFPRETPNLPKESTEKCERAKIESDDSCSAITSLIETDTLSSLSYPRSPSTGSYHPFPARPVLRIPKELGVRLGMYPRDSIHSPSK